MNKPRVFLIQESVMSYRAPIYEILAKSVDFTIGYTEKNEIKDSSYPIIKMPFRKIGPFKWHKHIDKTLNQYDVVLFVPHLSLIRLIIRPYFPWRKYKMVTWSLGVHASYKRLYDLSQKPSFLDKVFIAIQDKSDASVLYMPEPLEYWKQYRKLNENQFFIAHNTVAVAEFDRMPYFSNRTSILFIGTLYKQKGLGELIEAYAKAKGYSSKLPVLKIIGKGPEKDFIEKMIASLHLENDVILCGPIYDENILKDYFLDSVICVSPKQAGLSVLMSMGYGVPFVTRTDAITGGERNNIINGKNGMFYDNINELVDIIIATSQNPEKFAAMSNYSREYYLKNASPEGMAKGVTDAIEYALNR